jgi:hypothetical protein
LEKHVVPILSVEEYTKQETSVKQAASFGEAFLSIFCSKENLFTG